MALLPLDVALPWLFWLSAASLGAVLAHLLLRARSPWGWGLGWLGALVLVSGLVLYKVADSYTGAGFDEASLYYLRLGWKGLTTQLLAPLVLLAAMLGLGLGGLMWISWRAMSRRQGSPVRAARWAMGAVAMVALATNPGIIQAGLLVGATVHQEAYRQDLVSALVPLPSLTRPTHPRSLVLVYGESLERAYLGDPRFAHLTPHLRKLARQAVDFRGIGQTALTGWTIAGQVASQCGYPAVEGNDTFAQSVGQPLPCLTDALVGQGYAVSYLNGSDVEFGNKGTFWRAHGVKRALGNQAIKDLAGRPNAPSSIWGPYDDTLLAAARVELARLKAQPAPFVLVILTLDTHAPSGFPSPSCRDLPRPASRPMHQAIACSDRLLGAFISEVLAQGDPDLAVGLLSDHLQPQAVTATRDLDHPSRRENTALFWLPREQGRQVRRQGTSFDMFPTLLHMLGQPVGRAGLGADLLDPSQPTLVEQHGRGALDARLRSIFVRDSQGFFALAHTGLTRRPARQASW